MKLAGIALLVAVALPLAGDPRHDAFPLSTYPMFAEPRTTELTLDYALGETASGERRTLSPRLVGTGEVMQAYVRIDRAVQTGQAHALCAEIAARLHGTDIATVRIVTGQHDAVGYLVHHVVGPEKERARCRVP
jgi:hypothetical protein